jgi:hypothetical protein
VREDEVTTEVAVEAVAEGEILIKKSPRKNPFWILVNIKTKKFASSLVVAEKVRTHKYIMCAIPFKCEQNRLTILLSYRSCRRVERLRPSIEPCPRQYHRIYQGCRDRTSHQQNPHFGPIGFTRNCRYPNLSC